MSEIKIREAPKGFAWHDEMARLEKIFVERRRALRVAAAWLLAVLILAVAAATVSFLAYTAGAMLLAAVLAVLSGLMTSNVLRLRAEWLQAFYDLKEIRSRLQALEWAGWGP